MVTFEAAAEGRVGTLDQEARQEPVWIQAVLETHRSSCWAVKVIASDKNWAVIQ